MRTQARDFLAHLKVLNDTKYRSALDFTRAAVPRFAQLLGYSEFETFYEYPAAQYRADVVFSERIDATPWIVVELKNDVPRNPGDWIYQLRRYLDALGTSTGVVLSPKLLMTLVNGSPTRYDLNQINLDDVETIISQLRRGSQPKTVGTKPSKTRLEKLFALIETAATNEEKGKSLERLAQHILNNVEPLICKYRNLQTRSSEIDLVVEYTPGKRIPLFDEVGRYSLVECKNWSKPVGAKAVRDFIGKIERCRCQLGIIFSKNGVTGADAGADALREIYNAYFQKNLYVLVFSLEDLKAILDGTTLVSALDHKADLIRFDADQLG